MHRQRHLLGAWLLAGSLSVTAALAQEEASTPDDDREVKVSEDNYRRYMELDGSELQRNNLPDPQGQPPGGLEKMGRLPEASQRHLRDQLRGIIVTGGPWTPEEAGQRYPYVPSEAARGDAALRDRESEAWDELVNEYHQREAAIHAGARQADAAGAPGAGGAGGDGRQDGTDGENAGDGSAGRNGAGNQGDMAGSGGQSGDQQRTGDERNNSEAASSSASSSRQTRPSSPTPNPETPPVPDEGVSQSALEFLTGQPVSRQGRRGLLTLEELERARGLDRTPPPPEDDDPPDR